MRVVMLAGPKPSTWMVANALKREFSLSAIIVENLPGRWELARKRARRMGWPSVIGQSLFVLYAGKLQRDSRKRAAQILSDNGLETNLPDEVEIIPVPSANDDGTIALLQRLSPAAVVVCGTRILSPRVLESVRAPFINMHSGITPKYRGAHGAYWALANADPENAGVTVHLVDRGIDTGSILYQARISPCACDNFATYPLLQLSAGMPLLKQAVKDALGGRLRPVASALPSKLYHHPTLWQYLRSGVK